MSDDHSRSPITPRAIASVLAVLAILAAGVVWSGCGGGWGGCCGEPGGGPDGGHPDAPIPPGPIWLGPGFPYGAPVIETRVPTTEGRIPR